MSRVAVLLSVLAIFAFAVADDNIVQLAEKTADLSTLVTALNAANLVSALEGPGPFTVFAPTNEAFAKLPAKFLEYLLNNTDLLTQVLLFHVVSGKALSTNLYDNEVLSTLNSRNNLTVGIDNSGVYLNPPHPFEPAKVITANVLASNGVVHIVDTVLIPHLLENIVKLAEQVPELSTLVKAVVVANLTSVLSGPGPFTVLAPLNQAFTNLPAGVLDNLLKHPDQLAKVLTYHVISGAVFSKDLSDGQVITTVNGQSITCNIDNDGSVTFTGTANSTGTVVKADIEASNGVVHIIDGVLIPNL